MNLIKLLYAFSVFMFFVFNLIYIFKFIVFGEKIHRRSWLKILMAADFMLLVILIFVYCLILITKF